MVRSLNAGRTVIALFSPYSIMRVHDNPCLLDAEECNIIPLVIDDDEFCNTKINNNVVQNLANKMNGNVIVLTGKLKKTLISFIDSYLISETRGNQQLSIAYVNDSPMEYMQESFESVVNEIQSKYGTTITMKPFTDKLVNNINDNMENIALSSLSYPNYYNKFHKNIKKSNSLPKLNAKFNPINIKSINCEYAEIVKPTIVNEDNLVGEDYAIQLVKDYIRLDDILFTKKYYKEYIEKATSDDTKKSLERLRPTSLYSNYFQGEVLSALLSPLLAEGYISPRLLLHSRKILAPKVLERPLIDRIQNEIFRNDWHYYLASIVIQNNRFKNWDYAYQYYQGYTYRHGRMKNEHKNDKSKKWIVCVHGFGGQIDQFESLALNLRNDFHVTSLDLLGFGMTEKPPLSYNQYIWRDQLVSYLFEEAKRNGHREVILVGNSIGGFISSAACSYINYDLNSTDLQVSGLVLLNSAGRIDGPGLTVSTENYFKAYTGPSGELLRLFGTFLFTLLQPNIEKITEWLYVTDKTPVKRYLKDTILRDSNDPGAFDVLASGGKLPTPEPFNDLFRKFTGPILIAQGILDPLNNAKERAFQFQAIRQNITIDLIDAGHCPFDEQPLLLVKSIKQWAKNQNLLTTTA